MKRPSVIIAAAVLSGILYGLPKIPPVWRILVPSVCGFMVFICFMKCRGKSRKPLYFFVFLILAAGLSGYLRAEKLTERYSRPEVMAFFEPYTATNPGEFDYSLYLKTMGVSDEAARKRLKERDITAENRLEKLLGDLSENCSRRLESFFPEEDAGILKAMLLGNRNDMEDGMKQLYRSAGISHLLAVSGLHVSMIGMGAFRLLRKTGAPLRLSAAAAALLTGGYCLFTGASASAVRAAFMMILGFLAIPAGRRKDGAVSLSLAAAVLLFVQPYLILQSGFQLSFTAMAGVYCGSRFIERSELKNKAAQSFVSCLMISLMTLPVIAFCYFKAPLYSVFLNMAVIPLMSAVFLSGFAALAVSFAGSLFAGMPAAVKITQYAAAAAAAPAHYLLRLYEFLGNGSLALKFSTQILGRPEHIRIVLYYFLLLLLLGPVSQSGRRYRNLPVFFLFLIYLLAFPALRTKDTKEAYIEVLDVGQGDCFHIHEGKRNVIIDCGSSGKERAGSRILEPYLLSKGIGTVDLVIVSHADADHTNGLLYLLGGQSSVRTNAVLLPALAGKDEKYGDFFRCENAEVRTVHRGDRAVMGKGVLRCLYSEEAAAAMADTNRESAVWMYEFGEFRMLFTGDITQTEEEKILRQADRTELSADVLKAAHHGSKSSSSEQFLRAVSPDTVILSYGTKNRYGHPSGEVTERLRMLGTGILATEKTGAICIVPEKNSYSVRTWKQDAPQ